MNMSVTRIKTLSMVPPKKPAIEPTTVPKVVCAKRMLGRRANQAGRDIECVGRRPVDQRADKRRQQQQEEHAHAGDGQPMAAELAPGVRPERARRPPQDTSGGRTDRDQLRRRGRGGHQSYRIRGSSTPYSTSAIRLNRTTST